MSEASTAATATPVATVFQVLPDLLPDALHRAVWAVCERAHWQFGHQSHGQGGASLPFWKMDLDGVEAVNAAWEHARPACEAIAGRSLSRIRQYANGHTFGQGGKPHSDDTRPDTYTLLYYPIPAWQVAWEGETVFYDRTGEVVRAVLPAANRAIFFDSRIGHAGRSPSRFFGGLRVTVAFKLEAAA